MSVFVLAFAGLVASLPEAYAQTPSSIVGATSGNVGVTPSGAASYALPITVPPGTTGVQPKIALQYSSAAGNGDLGVGWSISGLTTISRCPTDLYYDDPANGGIGIDAVDYDGNDKFCLNGERLVAVNGTYGADGTEYRTAFESFTKIVSYGTTGSGPTWFKVWNKDGDILEYGNTTDSRVVGQSRPDVRAWMVNKISDRAGNYASYVYDQDVTSGTHRLSQILYTGNDAQGLSPYNSIDFVYATRPDILTSYHAGDKIVTDKRLTNVKVMAEGQLARDYRLTYGSGASSRSRLTDITECATTTSCFRPTTFDWSEDGGSSPFNKTTISPNDADDVPNGSRIAIGGDFNGDGRTDFYIHDSTPDGRAYGTVWPSRDVTWLSNGDGTFDKVTSNPSDADDIPNGSRIGTTGDFNGDGLSDFYTYDSRDDGRAYGTVWPSRDLVWLSNGDGTFDKATISANDADDIANGNKIAATGDFNGDGLTDFYVHDSYPDGRAFGTVWPSRDQVWLSKGDGTFDKVNISPNDADDIPNGSRIAASGDFNGDGLTDFYTFDSRDDGRAYGTVWPSRDLVWLSKGDGTFDKATISANDADDIANGNKIAATGDFNGDGLTDFYVHDSQPDGRAFGTVWPSRDEVWLSKGDGKFAKLNVSPNDADDIPNGSRIGSGGDFNGDGLTDFYTFDSRDDGRAYGTEWPSRDLVWLSKGDGTFDKATISANDADDIANGNKIAVTGDFNGDGLTDFYVHDSTPDGRAYGTVWPSRDWVWLSGRLPPDQLAEVTNGHGLATAFSYKPLTDSTVYTKGSGASYPNRDEVYAAQVVAEVVTDDGIGGTNSQTYTYSGLRSHLKGIGSLGFADMVVTDTATGIVDTTHYSQDWAQRHHGLMTSQQTVAPGPVVLSEKTVEWAVQEFGQGTPGARHFRYSPRSTAITRDLNGAFMARAVEETAYDTYGFPTSIVVATSNADGSEAQSKTTTNTYTHTPATWLLGRLTDASVAHKMGHVVVATAPADVIVGSNPVQTRTSSFTYTSEGLIASETIEPGHALSHTKTNTYNGFGAITAITETWGAGGGVSGTGLAATSRTTSFTYDAKVRYRLTETNPLGHVQTNTYDPITGLITSTTGPNGLATAFQYDDFGRVILETRADGTTTTTTRAFCAGSCPTYALYTVETSVLGGGQSNVVFDKLNHEIQTQGYSVGEAKWVDVDSEYDAKGRVARKSEPYFRGETKYWTTVTYDLIGRPLTTTRPDSSTETVVYNGQTQTNTNALAQTKTVTNNIAGNPAVVTDTQGNTITYAYDALGQVVSMTSSVGTSSSYAYDIRGNKTSDTDPDKGTWTYAYNALGMLVEQTNAKGQVTVMTYDVLARMLTRIDDANAANPALRTTTWVYDQGTKGLGKLTSATSSGYTVSNTYDSLGRPSSATETIGASVYTSTTTYDSYSRVDTTTYPTGVQVRNVYDSDGALRQVENASTSAAYWTRVAHDARGNVTQFELGNGTETTRAYQAETGNLTGITTSKNATIIQNNDYTFDAIGNLTRREDALTSQEETFVYDTLNRVIQTDTTTGGVTSTTTVSYDAKGNITAKSDVGTYTYGAPGGGCALGSAGPHAVTSIAGSKNATYCYDANGNMTSGDGRTITYTAFDMPDSITRGTDTTQFSYGPDRARFKRVDIGTGGTTTTLYIGGKALEEITAPGGSVTQKHYIGDFAVVTITQSAQTTDYLHRDHLGSVEVITDASCLVAQRMSFDAWGRRREINWQAMTDVAIAGFSTAITTRGFTGHEMVDSVGLVHMNGRVYDPTIGRFLSADPYVQTPSNLQSWNRYSYVLNNPLSYTDPTGFLFDKLFKKIKSFFQSVFQTIDRVFKVALNNPIVRAAIQIVGCTLTAVPTAGVGCAAISSAMTLAAGGSLVDALKAGAFAFAQMGIFDGVGQIFAGANAIVQAAVHGVVSGALAVVQGGEFVHGFISGALGKMGSVITRGFENNVFRTVVAAAFGCTGATVSGGKCVNGAVTAAFAHLFNEASSLQRAGQCGVYVVVGCLMVGTAVAATVTGPAAPVFSAPACALGGLAAAVACGLSSAPSHGTYDIILNSDGVIDIDESTPPFTGEPGSIVRGETQTRLYGPDGFPLTDRDLGHPNHKPPGCGDHCQDWERPAGGGKPSSIHRGPPRLPLPGDPPPPRGPGVPPP